MAAVRTNDFKYRITDQPIRWFGAAVKVDWPILTGLRLDPLERTNFYNGKDTGSVMFVDWWRNQFWRFVFVQQEIAEYAQTFLDYPPMQKGAQASICRT